MLWRVDVRILGFLCLIMLFKIFKRSGMRDFFGAAISQLDAPHRLKNQHIPRLVKNMNENTKLG